MDKPFDLKVIDLKSKIIEEINNSGLPITVLSMILHEITNAVDLEQHNVINNLNKQE